nr:MAG TPA: hypothetical protein [Bacteriophage sp.]
MSAPFTIAGIFSKINLCSFNYPATSPIKLIKFSQHHAFCYAYSVLAVCLFND